MEQAFLRMGFNVMARNCDDHTKNFAFRLKQGQDWELAPAYDVTHAHNPEGRMDLSAPDERQWTVQRHHARRPAAGRGPLRRQAAQGPLADVRAALANWPACAREASLSDATCDRVAADFWPLLGSSFLRDVGWHPALLAYSIEHVRYFRKNYNAPSKRLRGQAKLTEENIDEALREIRLALLEADVNFKVVKQLIDQIRAKAVGQEVLTALSPGEQVIKIVRDELVEILGKDTARMKFASQPPTVVLMAGLQGSGKTTTSGKLANWFKTGGHRPLLVSVDVYRPAAREQLKVVAQAVKAQIYEGHVAADAYVRGNADESDEASTANLPMSSVWRKKRAARPSSPAATCSSSILPAACTSTISSWTRCSR